MKSQPPFQIIFLFVCVCVLGFVTVAQVKTKAFKFDEFDDSVKRPVYVYNEITLAQRTERFANQLKRERAVKAYVIHYLARINDDFNDYASSNRISRIRQDIRSKTNLADEDVVTIDGGHRERKTIEFWIVPKNSAPPAPTPTLDKSETFNCRSVYVNENVSLAETGTVDFSVLTDLRGVDDYSTTWRVSTGEIVYGQGSDRIRVKVEDGSVKQVTAFVEVGGLPFPCPKIFSATAEIKGKLRLIDDFGLLANGETRARLDNFLSSLQNYPAAKGYVVIYGNRTDRNNRDAVRRTTLFYNHFKFRNFDVSRITIINGGFREEMASELWLSFDDAEKPIPTPTVDEKFVVVPKPARKSRPRKK